MNQSRRALLAAASAGLSLVGRPLLGDPPPSGKRKQRDCSALDAEIQELFANLPERKAFKFWAPATENAPEFLAELHGSERLFSASTNKAFILCERLRQLDSPCVEEQLVAHELKLDESVWSVGSTVFNPPNLSGLVSEGTAMEAMITHSDNTATDMVLKQAGVENVRQFIASIGLTSTMIPDSTRVFAGYLFGAPDYKNVTWDEVLSLSSSWNPFCPPRAERCRNAGLIC